MSSARFQSTILLHGEETAGALSVIDNTAPAGWGGPPLHHHAFDEAFHVLDGELTFQLGDELATAGPGTSVFAPGDAIHTLANPSSEQARYLLICTPAGFERRFEEFAAGAAGAEPPAEAASAPIPETIVVGGQLTERDDLASARPLEPATGGVNVVVRSEQSAGRIGLMDNFVDADAAGPPLHHHDFDETFIVLEGELTYQLGDELVTRRAGEHVFAARGATHTFANLSGEPARQLLACTPAGFERYFGRIAASRQGVEPPEWAQQPTPEVTVVGPQIAR